MNIDNYEIKSIESIKFYGHKIIEKNIPDSIEVTKHEFNTFIKMQKNCECSRWGSHRINSQLFLLVL